MRCFSSNVHNKAPLDAVAARSAEQSHHGGRKALNTRPSRGSALEGTLTGDPVVQSLCSRRIFPYRQVLAVYHGRFGGRELIDGFPEAGQEVQPMGGCVSTMTGAAPTAEEVSTAKPFF
jgi:hypothetical protein